MANEHHMLIKTSGNRMITATRILLGIGIAGVIISSILVFVGLFSGINEMSEEAWGSGIIVIIGFLLLIVAFLVLAAGIILYFVGRSKEKKQKNQNIPLA